MIRAESLEDLVDVSVLLSAQPLPLGRRVAVLTNAGGLGILAADACEAAGLELPTLSDESASRLAELLPSEASVANPVDMLGSATAATYESVLPVLLEDHGVDAVLVLFVPPVTATADEVALAVARASKGAEKPVLAAVMDARGIPPASPTQASPRSRYPESAARALGRAAARAEWLPQARRRRPGLDRIDRRRARAVVGDALARAPDRWLDPGETRALLVAYGIPVVEERVAATPDEAARAAAELGFPAVVKTALAGAHKTETGGVALDLPDEDAVREAAARIGGPVHRPADEERKRRAPRRARPGSALRPARRARTRRRHGRADRRRGHPDRAAHGRRRAASSCSTARRARSFAATAASPRPTPMP